MSEHIERMKIEQRDLNEKIEKLNAFVETNPIFKTLSEVEQYLLKKQLLLMEEYLATLILRLLIAEDKPNYSNMVLNKNSLKLIPNLEKDNTQMFEIKEIARQLSEFIESYGKNPRRIAIANTHIEIACMMGIKSLFT